MFSPFRQQKGIVCYAWQTGQRTIRTLRRMGTLRVGGTFFAFVDFVAVEPYAGVAAKLTGFEGRPYGPDLFGWWPWGR